MQEEEMTKIRSNRPLMHSDFIDINQVRQKANQEDREKKMLIMQGRTGKFG